MSNNSAKNKKSLNKTNKPAKTTSIKISTDDEDPLTKNNSIPISKKSKKNIKTQDNTNLTQKTNLDNSEITKILEKEKDSLNNTIKIESEEDFKTITSLNSQIAQLEEEYSLLSKNNYKIINKLKQLENQVLKKFFKKYKLSKILSKQKELMNSGNINKEIKTKESQVILMKKKIEYNKKETEKLSNLLEEVQEENEETLLGYLKEFNNYINKLEKEIKILKQMRYEHNNCKKTISNLTSKLNVILNDIEFEEKMLNKIEVEIKPPTERKMQNKIHSYSERIRYNSLEHSENRYNSRRSLDKYKIFKLLLQESESKTESGPYTYRQKGSVKTLSNVGNSQLYNSSRIRKEIKYKIDCKSPKNYLFSEKEKEVLNKMVPEDYLNNLNLKYNNIENEIKDIQGEIDEEKVEMKSCINNNKLRIDILNLKVKEEKMKIIIKNNIINNNNKKIANLNREIAQLKKILKKEKSINTRKINKKEEEKKLIEEKND